LNAKEIRFPKREKAMDDIPFLAGRVNHGPAAPAETLSGTIPGGLPQRTTAPARSSTPSGAGLPFPRLGQGIGARCRFRQTALGKTPSKEAPRPTAKTALWAGDKPCPSAHRSRETQAARGISPARSGAQRPTAGLPYIPTLRKSVRGFRCW